MEPTAKKNFTARTKTALWFLFSPTALFLVSVLAYNIVRTIKYDRQGVPDGTVPTAEIVSTMTVFAAGTLGILTLIPGLIIGIILLATRKKYYAEN